MLDWEAVRAVTVAELAPWGIVPPDDLPRRTRRRVRSLADRWISAAERAYQLGGASEALYTLVWMLRLAPTLPLTRALDLRAEYFCPVDVLWDDVKLDT